MDFSFVASNIMEIISQLYNQDIIHKIQLILDKLVIIISKSDSMKRNLTQKPKTDTISSYTDSHVV